jgi:hypothetical protein
MKMAFESTPNPNHMTNAHAQLSHIFLTMPHFFNLKQLAKNDSTDSVHIMEPGKAIIIKQFSKSGYAASLGKWSSAQHVKHSEKGGKKEGGYL